MNLSLIITFVLIAIVLPWLWRKLFIYPADANQTPLLDVRSQHLADKPVMRSSYKEPIFDTMLSDTAVILPHQRSTPNGVIHQQHDLLNQYHFKTCHVVAAPKQLFIGYDLLQALHNAGLEYGTDELFHYYSDDEADEIFFSVASSCAPGTFDLQNIGAFSTSALTFFIDTDKIKHSEMVYDVMLEIAQQLADELGGEVRTNERK